MVPPPPRVVMWYRVVFVAVVILMLLNTYLQQKVIGENALPWELPPWKNCDLFGQKSPFSVAFDTFSDERVVFTDSEAPVVPTNDEVLRYVMGKEPGRAYYDGAKTECSSLKLPSGETVPADRVVCINSMSTVNVTVDGQKSWHTENYLEELKNILRATGHANTTVLAFFGDYPAVRESEIPQFPRFAPFLTKARAVPGSNHTFVSHHAYQIPLNSPRHFGIMPYWAVARQYNERPLGDFDTEEVLACKPSFANKKGIAIYRYVEPIYLLH